MVAEPKRDEQSGMFDVEIDDEELEAALIEHIETAEIRREQGRIQKRIKQGKERIGLADFLDGQRVRIGSVVFESAVVERDGFEVEPSRGVRMRGVQVLRE